MSHLHFFIVECLVDLIDSSGVEQDIFCDLTPNDGNANTFALYDTTDVNDGLHEEGVSKQTQSVILSVILNDNLICTAEF